LGLSWSFLIPLSFGYMDSYPKFASTKATTEGAPCTIRRRAETHRRPMLSGQFCIERVDHNSRPYRCTHLNTFGFRTSVRRGLPPRTKVCVSLASNSDLVNHGLSWLNESGVFWSSDFEVLQAAPSYQVWLDLACYLTGPTGNVPCFTSAWNSQY
jgi:hypothetical protein